jgi:uncharacterized membrane protein YGL010W
MALFSERGWDEWIAAYAKSHLHPVNRACHTVGIPLIALSFVTALAALAVPRLWLVAVVAFGAGWTLQFVGHAFEGKPPEFLKDWRFLFVGLRWWIAKLRGRA